MDTATADRRRATRCQCSVTTSWRVLGIHSVPTGTGWLEDVSSHGALLVLDIAPKPGIFVEVSLRRPDSELPIAPRLLRVRRVVARSLSTWAVGCSWVNKLSQEELDQLV